MALRRLQTVETGTSGEDWSVLMLNLMPQKFKVNMSSFILRSSFVFQVVKLNKEAVRGLWAAQQQELVRA